MKILLKISLFIIILLIVLLGLLQIDDRLSPETKAWMEKTQTAVNTDNDAYFYFLGLMAPENQDPIDVGKAIHQQVLAQPLPTYNADGSKKKLASEEEYQVYNIDEGLKVRNKKNYCRVFEAGCFERLISDESKTLELVENNHVLHQRYKKFLSLPDYQMMHPIGNFVSWPNYQSLIDSNNISLINLLAVESQDQLNRQYAELLDETRLKLSQAGTIIEKMIYVALVNHNLEFYNLIYKHDVINQPISLKSLSEEEKDMLHPMSYESLTGTAMSNHFEFAWYELVNKAFIKKNMILNNYYETTQQYSKLSKLPPHQQVTAKTSDGTISNEVSFLDKYRNLSGWVLTQIAIPAYDDYMFRVSDLDAKIAVLNWRLQQPHDADINEEYLEQHDTARLNPYKIGSFFIKKEESGKQKLLCVPLEQHRDPRNVRCVQL